MERTATTQPNFYEIQKFVVIMLGMSIVPVTCYAEAAKLLAKMVSDIKVNMNEVWSKFCTKLI